MNEAIAKGMTYGGAGSALIFGWDANTLAAVLGVVIAGVGLAITWHYKRKQDKREQAEHELRMRGEL